MFRLLTLTAVAAAGLMAQNAPVNWAGTVDNNGSPARIYLSLRHEGFDLVGTVTYAGAVLPIENGFLNGDQATFETRDAARRVNTFRLTAADGRLTGDAKFGGQAMQLSLLPLTTDEAVTVVTMRLGANGQITKIAVNSSRGLGMDEKAIQAVKTLSFQPSVHGIIGAIVPE